MKSSLKLINKRLLHFIFVRRQGMGGKVVSLTEFIIRQVVKPLGLTVCLTPGKILWIIGEVVAVLAPSESAHEQAQCFRVGHPSWTVGKRGIQQVNARCLAAILTNFIFRFAAYGSFIRDEVRTKDKVCIPAIYVLSPTMRCNLRCKGCYAALYDHEDEMEFAVIDRVISEGKDLGIYNLWISGGEPFLHEDILDIFHKHSDVFFQVFTNGTLIDTELARKLARLGNVVPLISLEGFEKETDAWREKGVFQRVMQAMDNLRKVGVPFGYSAVITPQNIDTVLSDEFIDMLIEKGCLLGWHFPYIPIGRDPDLELMLTPEQRLRMKTEGGERIRSFKPILMFDFASDGPYANGCVAGRHLLHINAHGDVEPCVFLPFAVDNVKEKSLMEVLKSPFFEAFRNRQPYCDNLMRPCPIHDHPQVLREIIAEFKPYPTHSHSEALVTTLSESLDQYAEKVAKLLDPLWKQRYASNGFKCRYYSSFIKASRVLYVEALRERRGDRIHK